MKALVFDRFGAPDVLQYREIRDPKPRDGQALVRLRAIGLNFADVYRRQGRYHLAGDPPWICGYEGAGVVEEVCGAADVAVGDRVGFADSPFANAERVAVDADHLVPLPDGVAFETAAAVLLQGLTAQYLVRDSHRLQGSEVALVHAAAGGVGLLLTQMARNAGARVIALASSPAKQQAARDAGADTVIAAGGDWVDGVLQATEGRGVDVAYDSVGTTVLDSLKATRVGGHVVFYGMAAGTPPAVDPRLLMDRSQSLTGGDLWNVLRTRDDRRQRAAELLGDVSAGRLAVHVARSFPLAEGGDAHAFLESRASIGKVLLIP
jgi:NADPH2:quinone reductase